MELKVKLMNWKNQSFPCFSSYRIWHVLVTSLGQSTCIERIAKVYLLDHHLPLREIE